MERMPVRCVVALLVPLGLAAAVVGSVAAGEAVGLMPFSGIVPRNSAEAAGLGRAHDVLRFLRNGEDPHRVYPIKPEIISLSVRYATTLEAAMWSRQLELIQLLERHGAIMDADRPALACLAADLRVDGVVEHLAPEGTAHCEAGAEFERVLARTPDQ